MKSQKPTIKRSPKLRIGLLILVIAILAGGGIFLYKHHQKTQAIAKERAEYVQAEKDLDMLTTEITNEVSSSTSEEWDKSCGYSSVEFGHGDLYCGATKVLVYEVKNRMDADSLVKTIATVVKDSSTFQSGYSSDALAHTLSPPPVQLLSTDLKSRTGLQCSISYLYYENSNRTEGYSDLTPVATDGLQIGANCGSRPALTAYYPLEKK